MTTELTYLTLTSLLLSSLWIPFIVGVSQNDAARFKENMVTPPDPARLPAWVQRANRVQLNLVEQFGPFATLIIVAHLADISNTYTVWSATLFFWFRVAHAVVMWTGFNAFPLRSIIFTCAWLCILVLGWQVLT